MNYKMVMFGIGLAKLFFYLTSSPGQKRFLADPNQNSPPPRQTSPILKILLNSPNHLFTVHLSHLSIVFLFLFFYLGCLSLKLLVFKSFEGSLRDSQASRGISWSLLLKEV